MNERHLTGGYFVSRFSGEVDCTGTVLGEITLANDHSQRRYFPDAWTLSWVTEADADRREAARRIGLQGDLREAMRWADDAFEVAFGAWSCFYTLDAAREAARRFLPREGTAIWGAGLPESHAPAFLRRHAPPPPAPGFAPMGAGGVYQAVARGAPLAPGGSPLGYEVLTYDLVCFQSPQSLHRAEPPGLLPDLEAARAACARCGPEWLPWRIVQYA